MKRPIEILITVILLVTISCNNQTQENKTIIENENVSSDNEVQCLRLTGHLDTIFSKDNFKLKVSIDTKCTDNFFYDTLIGVSGGIPDTNISKFRLTEMIVVLQNNETSKTFTINNNTFKDSIAQDYLLKSQIIPWYKINFDPTDTTAEILLKLNLTSDAGFFVTLKTGLGGQLRILKTEYTDAE